MFPIPEVLNSSILAGILGCEVGSLPKSIWDSSLELRTKVQTFERGYLINVKGNCQEESSVFIYRGKGHFGEHCPGLPPHIHHVLSSYSSQSKKGKN